MASQVSRVLPRTRHCVISSIKLGNGCFESLPQSMVCTKISNLKTSCSEENNTVLHMLKKLDLSGQYSKNNVEYKLPTSLHYNVEYKIGILDHSLPKEYKLPELLIHRDLEKFTPSVNPNIQIEEPVEEHRPRVEIETRSKSFPVKRLKYRRLKKRHRKKNMRKNLFLNRRLTRLRDKKHMKREKRNLAKKLDKYKDFDPQARLDQEVKKAITMGYDIDVLEDYPKLKERLKKFEEL